MAHRLCSNQTGAIDIIIDSDLDLKDKPVAFFKLFYPDAVLEIRGETNRYANQVSQDKDVTHKTRKIKWKITHEIEVYMSLLALKSACARNLISKFLHINEISKTAAIIMCPHLHI